MPFSSIEELRAARDQKLQESDWLMLPDAPEVAGGRGFLITYRVNLRELPRQAEVLGLDKVELPDDTPLLLASKVPPAEEESSEEASSEEESSEE